MSTLELLKRNIMAQHWSLKKNVSKIILIFYYNILFNFKQF